MYVQDTIAAICTPLGEGGIGIVRVSGPDAVTIAAAIFRGKSNGGLQSHRFYYGDICNPADGQAIDEVLVVLMLTPRSYTREDVFEIHCHGGYLVVQKVLETVLGQGARLAEPGEFTRRAFLNGRLDLVQAEAVIDVIRCKTEAALTLAQHQREGFLSQRLAAVRVRIVEALALIEAYIDFPEDEVGDSDIDRIAELVAMARGEVDSLLAGFREGKVLREGVTVMIAGKPNVGKSSLLNTLLREKRAIVTSVPGTTRDIIEDVVNIRGLPVRLLDTAGIRETSDLVEQEGVRLTMERIPTADLVLFVLDGTRPYDDDDDAILQVIRGQQVVAVINKCDLPCELVFPASLTGVSRVHISTLTGDGMDLLRTTIHDMFLRGEAVDRRDFVAISQVRHRDALAHCGESLADFVSDMNRGASLEFLAVHLREALRAVGEVTGETTPDEVLDLIFQRFCVGK